MKRIVAYILLIVAPVACSTSEPVGVSDDGSRPVTSRKPGPPPGQKPGPPPPAGQPAELTVVKTAVPLDASVPAGSPIAFDLRVTNNGPGTAVDVHLTDNLLNLGFPWTVTDFAGQPISCMFIGETTTLFCGSHPASSDDPALPQIDLAPGEFFSLRVSSPTPSDNKACGTVTNTAAASADNAPGVSASASIVVVCAQLTIVKTSTSPDAPILAGDPIAFDLWVTNNGPVTAVDVHLTDNLPILGSTWTITEAGGQSIGCKFIGESTSLFCGSHPASSSEPALPQVDLAPGEFFSLRVSSATDESDCGTVTNTANAFADNAPTVSDPASAVIICPPQ